MSELKIVATVVAKPEFQNDLEQAFQIVVDETRKEAGNVLYELNRNVNNPLKYIILETWQSQEAINLHNDSAHFKAFVNAIEGKVESLTVDVIRKVY
ncbi:MAG: antibiotic biosynthesis monooxygenase [Prevotellaceae bacterium]|jgi:quinol monooxygenase YgiN|nr:antibiotic biosynthesis monooxygenase [Prevotellaceae bacterium]